MSMGFVKDLKDLLIKEIKISKVVLCVIIAFINAVCTQAVVSHACFGWDPLQRRNWWLYFFWGLIASWVFVSVMDALDDDFITYDKIRVKEACMVLDCAARILLFVLASIPYHLQSGACELRYCKSGAGFL